MKSIVVATIASLSNGVEAQFISHLRNSNHIGIQKTDLQHIINAVKSVNPEQATNAQRVLDGQELK